MKKGQTMECGSCGLAVTVCDECGCDTDELICCGQPMKARKAKKTTKRTTRKAPKASK